jgi:hypothetical protein
MHHSILRKTALTFSDIPQKPESGCVAILEAGDISEELQAFPVPSPEMSPTS